MRWVKFSERTPLYKRSEEAIRHPVSHVLIKRIGEGSWSAISATYVYSSELISFSTENRVLAIDPSQYEWLDESDDGPYLEEENRRLKEELSKFTTISLGKPVPADDETIIKKSELTALREEIEYLRVKCKQWSEDYSSLRTKLESMFQRLK